MSLPEKFCVNIYVGKISQGTVQAKTPSQVLIEQSQESNKKSNNLIKINKNQILTTPKDSNKIVLPKLIIDSTPKLSKPLRKSQVIEDESLEEIEDNFEDLEIQEDDEEMDIEEDFEEEDIEDPQISLSSGDKKLTKRQLNAFTNLNKEPLYQLQDKKIKNKNKVILTEEEIKKRNLKEIERKQKLQKQQEEFKKQTVDKILNEVGKKQKQRQEQELKDTQKKEHNYKQLPAGELIVKYISNREGEKLIIHPYLTVKTLLPLENKQMQNEHQNQIINCSNCPKKYKYKIPQSDQLACSLNCYKVLKLQG